MIASATKKAENNKLIKVSDKILSFLSLSQIKIYRSDADRLRVRVGKLPNANSSY